MKNLAIIVHSLNSGGAERTASNLSLLLSNHYNVHLILFDGSNISYPYKGTLHNLNIPSASSPLKKTNNLIKRARMTKELKRKLGINYSISLMDGANIVNVLSSVGDRIITSVRIQMSKSRNASHGLTGLINRRIMKYIGRKSYKIVALSKGVEEDLNLVYRIPHNKLETIYNPCDYEALLKNADKNNIQLDSGNAIVTMGRMTDQKGQWHLIRAITEIKKTVPNIKLYVLGIGPLENELKNLTRELNLEDCVFFLGFIKAPHACFKYCDAFVFPSEFEGLGNVLLEAMAFGLPCISSDCFSGPREIIAPGTQVKEHLNSVELCEYGILTSVCGKGEFDAQSPLTTEELQLAKSIIMLLTDDDLRLHYKSKSLERREFFSPEKIAKDWISLLER